MSPERFVKGESERTYRSFMKVGVLLTHPRARSILLDCTLEMRQLGWAHFAGKGLQSEAEAILSEVSAYGR
jgi:hypothetical protein